MDVTSELTIVIPLRIDCPERKENLDTVLYSLLELTNSSIIILEADTEQKYFLSESNERIKYIFMKDNNVIFHRTRYINILLKMAQTNIIGIWDTDVILDAKQIQQAASAVKKGTTLCYPYDGHFLFLDKEQSDNIREDILSCLNNKDKIKAPSMGRPSAGGAFIVNKECYLKAGGENENFYGWGPEDAERYKRMEILEEPIRRIEGALFHLHHPRGINSTFGSDDRDKQNVRELIKICSMTKNNLLNYINTWSWKQ